MNDEKKWRRNSIFICWTITVIVGEQFEHIFMYEWYTHAVAVY